LLKIRESALDGRQRDAIQSENAQRLLRDK